MSSAVTIDGAQGEGGGQILRTALALSLATGRPFLIHRIRSGRRRPGLLHQHLTAVRAAAAVGPGSQVQRAELGSQELSFSPGEVRAGKHRFQVGTAGSATLVLQTVLPALLTAPGPSLLTVEGGTHNPQAPPFEFLERSFLPLLARMGGQVQARLERHGFYPAGGGRISLAVTPCAAGQLAPLVLPERGRVLRYLLCARVAHLPRSIAEREVRRVQERLRLPAGRPQVQLEVEELELEPGQSAGPGNVLLLQVQSEQVTEVIAGFGRKGLRAEAVADQVARDAGRYLAAGVPVGEHLADQLLLPLALAGRGIFRTLALSSHARTTIDVIRAFVDLPLRVVELGGERVEVQVGEQMA